MFGPPPRQPPTAVYLACALVLAWIGGVGMLAAKDANERADRADTDASAATKHVWRQSYADGWRHGEAHQRDPRPSGFPPWPYGTLAACQSWIDQVPRGLDRASFLAGCADSTLPPRPDSPGEHPMTTQPDPNTSPNTGANIGADAGPHGPNSQAGPGVLAGFIAIPPVPVLFLDLDGTVRHHATEPGAFINDPDDVAVYPEAVTMMKRWRAGGGRIVGVTNQGGIALGHLTLHTANSINARTLHLAGHLIDRLVMCVHHPSATNAVQAYCWCRKPAPGMLIMATGALAQATGEWYPPHVALMVGDMDTDRQCAERAGVDFQDAGDWRAQAGYVA